MTNSSGSDPSENERSDEQRFVCPECLEEIGVNAGVKQAILDHGCPVCTAPVSEDAFQ